MPNNIAVKVTADVAGATANLAVARADLQAYQKELRKTAEEARTTGQTPELQTAILAQSEAVAKAQATVALYSRELNQLKAAQATSGVGEIAKDAAGAARAMETLHGGTAGVTREMIVLAREAGRGNFSRMAGSVTILAQRMGLLTPAVIGTGFAIAGIAAPLAIFTIAAEQGSEQLAKFNNAMEATNGYAGLTITQTQRLAQSLANWSGEGVGQASKTLLDVAKAGQFTGQTLNLVAADATRMGQLTGESADKFITDYSRMNDGVAKFALEYNQHYHQLTTAQLVYIEQLETQGQKEDAERALAQDVYNYLGQQAPEQLGALERAWRAVAQAASGAWDAMKSVGRNSLGDQIDRTQEQLDYYTRLSENHGAGGRDVNNEISALNLKLALLKDTERAQEKQAQTAATAAATQTDGAAAAAKLKDEFEASRTSGEKLKQTIADINTQLAKAIRGDPGHKALFEQEAAAARSQAEKSDAIPKGPKGESPINAMEAELRQSEFNIKSQTGDWQKDMQALEAKFWEGKLAEAKKGSKLYGEILAKVQEAELGAGSRSAEQKRQIAVSDIDSDLKGQTSGIAAQRANAESAYDSDDPAVKISADKKRALLEQLAQEEADFEIQAQERKKAAYGADVVAVHEAANAEKDIRANLGEQLAQIERQYTEDKKREDEKRLEATKKAAEQEKKAWSDANREILAGENTLISGIFGGRENLGQILRNLALQTAEREVEADVGYWTERKLLQAEGLGAEQAKEEGGVLVHLLQQQQKAGAVATSEAQQTAATTTGVAIRTTAEAGGAQASRSILSALNEKQISADAAKAASGAYSAVAGIPIIGPVLAPAAAATAFAGVMAFENLASLAVGTNYVPSDMMAQIHEGERIIPKADNRAIMQAVGASPGGAGGGPSVVHNHNWNINALNARDVANWARSAQGRSAIQGAIGGVR